MSRRSLAHDARGIKKPPFLPLLEVDDFSSESPQQGTTFTANKYSRYSGVVQKGGGFTI